MEILVFKFWLKNGKIPEHFQRKFKKFIKMELLKLSMCSEVQRFVFSRLNLKNINGKDINN